MSIDADTAEILRLVKNIEKISTEAASVQVELLAAAQNMYGAIKELIAICTKEGDGKLAAALQHLADAVQSMSGKIDELIVSRH